MNLRSGLDLKDNYVASMNAMHAEKFQQPT